MRPDFGAPPGTDTMLESIFAAASVLRSEAVDWLVTDYKSKYANCFEVYLLNTTFSEDRNAIMNGRREPKGDTYICGRDRRWKMMLSYCHGYLDNIGPLDMSIV